MTNKEKAIQPIKITDFGEAKFKYTTHDARVPSDITMEDLLNPQLWQFVGRKLAMGDEIRVVPDDFSFRALLMVTHAQGSMIHVKLIHGVELDAVEDVAAASGMFEAKLRGRKKWCVLNTKTGEEVKEGIATQAEAIQIAADLQKAYNM